MLSPLSNACSIENFLANLLKEKLCAVIEIDEATPSGLIDGRREAVGDLESLASLSPDLTVMSACSTIPSPSAAAKESHASMWFVSESLLSGAANFVARLVTFKSFPQKSEEVRSIVFAMLNNLASGGWATATSIVIACALLRRAILFPHHSAKLSVSPATTRRLLIAALRLAAKFHEDEYFTLHDMCLHADIPHSDDAVRMTASSEWKLFLALDMNCSLPVDEYEEARADILSEGQTECLSNECS